MRYDVKNVPGTDGFVIINEMGHQVSGVMTHNDASSIAFMWMHEGIPPLPPTVTSPLFKRVIDWLVEEGWQFEVGNARSLVNGDPLSMMMSEDLVGTELRFLFVQVDNVEVLVYDYDHLGLTELFNMLLTFN